MPTSYSPWIPIYLKVKLGVKRLVMLSCYPLYLTPWLNEKKHSSLHLVIFLKLSICGHMFLNFKFKAF